MTSTRGPLVFSGSAFSCSDTVQLPNCKDDTGRIGLALILYNVHPPRFMALSQFSPYILTLEKQGYAVFAPKPLCISKELRQRRASPGSDDIEALALQILDSNLPQLDSEVQPRRDRSQKAAFLCRRV